MKRMLLCVLAVVLAANLAGCVRMHSVTDIKDDGSGTASIEFGLSQAVADAIKELQAMDPDAGGDMEMPSISDIKQDRIEKAIKPYNVKMTEFEHKTADGRETIRMAFAFQDLKGLSAAMAAAMGETPDQGMGIYETGDGNFVLKQASYDFSDFPVLDEEEEAAESEPSAAPAEQTPEQMQKQMEVMGKLMGAMAELDVSLKITVPGDIIETNAPLQEGRTSVWTINSSNMMTAGQDMDPVITFSGKGLKIRNALKQ